MEKSNVDVHVSKRNQKIARLRCYQLGVLSTAIYGKMADMDAETMKLEQMLQGSGELPSTKELLDMLETTEMDEELRENLRNMLSSGVPKLFGGAGTYMAIVFVLFIFSIMLFFGYKLYKSIKEKEVKREEKKKLKQMKKKK